MPNPVVTGETAPQTALPAQVDIYDFDKTLVPFDSGSLFIGYCALHYPWVLVYLPVWFIACLLFALRVLSLQKFKNLCFGFCPWCRCSGRQRAFGRSICTGCIPGLPKRNARR